MESSECNRGVKNAETEQKVRYMEMENQIETLYVIIALLAGGLGIVVTFLIKFRKKQEDSIQRREHEEYV